MHTRRQADEGEPFKKLLGAHEIFLPSNFGGRLTVGLREPRNGSELRVVDSKDKVHKPDQRGVVRIDLDAGKRGTGLFRVAVFSPKGSYRPFALFDEVGIARDQNDFPLVPWNFWYWPFARSEKALSAWGGTLLQPIQKYEKAFGVKGVLDWERTHHNDPTGTREDWEGHCHAGAMASILFFPPPDDGLTFRGVKFECEELKFLATEMVLRYANFGDTWIFPDKATTLGRLSVLKPQQDPAAFREALVSMLAFLRREVMVKGQPILMDLRDPTGLADHQTWNHALFKYETRYWQPDPSDPTRTEGRTILFANADSPPEDGKSLGMPADVSEEDGEFVLQVRKNNHHRVVCKFEMRFDGNGFFDELSPDTKWLSATAGGTSTFAPRHGVVVRRLSAEPNPLVVANPLIEREHVLQLMTLRKQFT
jgi:hypothetical protein